MKKFFSDYLVMLPFTLIATAMWFHGDPNILFAIVASSAWLMFWHALIETVSYIYKKTY